MMAESIELHCSFGDCKSEALVYCSVCDLLLCNTHQTAHDDLYKKKTKPHPLISAREYSANRGGNSPFCGLHETLRIKLACARCYQPMCDKCIDDTAITIECGPSGQEKHINRSVEHVAGKIEDELNDLLSALSEKEEADSNNVTTRRALYKEQMEKSRDDLNKLDATMKELREILEKFAKSSKQEIVDSMNKRKELMENWEKTYEDHQKACAQKREQVSNFKKMNKEVIIKNQKQIIEDLQVQIQSKLEDGPQLPEQLFLEVLDKPLDIPVRLRESPPHTNTPTAPILPIPTHFQYRESQAAPNYVACVYFTKKGKLLYSGLNSGISGLSFTATIPTDISRYNFSLCEYNNHLYILQNHYEHKQYQVHKINLSDQSVSENIIKFQASDRYSQQMVLNDEFIIISDTTAECLRIYSSRSAAHLFNIKHECISSDPRGVGLLGDALVVGDQIKKQVSSLTINDTPEVRWTCTGIIEPAALRVIENPQIILVASRTTKQIYVISYQGEKLSTLAVPECSDNIFDIAVYGDQIAVADRTKQVKLYEMKEEG